MVELSLRARIQSSPTQVFSFFKVFKFVIEICQKKKFVIEF